MKKIYTGLASVMAASAMAFSASAADLSAPSGYKDYTPAVWTGFYAGANLGYGWGASSDQLADSYTGFGGLSPEGWLGGIQLGYNWQPLGTPFVLGVETDIDASSISGQSSGSDYKSRLQALGTVRGRAGYALDRTLVYATGGFAYGSIDNQAEGGYFATNASKVVTGYTLGGGVEYKVKRDLSLKVEYQYVNLGKNDPVNDSAGAFSLNGGTVHDDAYNTVRLGLNYFPFAAREPLK